MSALTLDPSGARILSGSHDYDCKLWDFGGMDARCKPFKTWEPAGTYYVRHISPHFRLQNVDRITGVSPRFTTSNTPTTGLNSWSFRGRPSPSCTIETVRRCKFTVQHSSFSLQSHARLCRTTFIKGDPYIRDMKNTRCVFHSVPGARD